KPFPDAHFAVYPQELIRPCILAGCPPWGVVLDPFFGAGTTGLVAKQEGRHYLGIELNEAYVEMAAQRIQRECPMERLIV
ncbi:MAG TPA: site-specific DNA-methyltransferase, partial [Armatimonadota bacterium]|nr:site-specific DNA-methyltransferase [Armatimonadota bacterium]